jgi:acyl-CoA thioesterase-1
MNRHRNHCWRSISSRRLAAWAILAIVCTAMACNSDHPTPETGQTASAPGVEYEGTIVALGDSLTAGYGVPEDEAYPARLARRLEADGYRFEVINAGISGETSSGVRSRIQWVLSSLKPDIVILETGANDGLRGQDPGLLQKNMEELLARMRNRNIVVVLAGMRMLPNLGIEYTQAFDDVYPRVAATNGVIFMPFFLGSVAGRTRFTLPDKLHPNSEGYERIVEDIYPYVLRAIERFRMTEGLIKNPK